MTKQEFFYTLFHDDAYLSLNFDDSSNYRIDYWYPLRSLEESIPVVAFDLWKIYKDNKFKQIETVLSLLSIDAATAIQNQVYSPEPRKVCLKSLLYEADKDGYNFPWYVESYYFDDSKQWMIYTSHELTITFAGDELARIAKQTIDSKYIREQYHIRKKNE